MRGIVGTLLLTALALTACSDPGNRPPGQRSPDTKAWEGAQNRYVAPGWKAGDEKSWDQQMRNRAQGQNEYARVNP